MKISGKIESRCFSTNQEVELLHINILLNKSAILKNFIFFN